MSFDTPVLLIAWKRPTKVLKVIDSLKQVKPNYIYVACDGPNRGIKDEVQKVTETRKIIEMEINWNYKKFKKFYRETNHGAMYGVSDAITWFFQNEAEGIILEDDCLANKDFYHFSAEMLKKYRTEERIWSITGNNFQKGNFVGNDSYYFSCFTHIWGWATWKRCWEKYEVDIKSWPDFKKRNKLNHFFCKKHEKKYWSKIFDQMYKNKKPDTWDYQWFFSSLNNKGLNIIPNTNLVENIGFGSDSTNTKSKKSPLTYKKESSKINIFPLKHPKKIIRSVKADDFTSRKYYSGYPIHHPKYFLNLIKKIFTKTKTIVLKNFNRN